MFIKNLLGIVGLVSLLAANPVMGACGWKSVASGNLDNSSIWVVESGTPAVGQTCPASGDSIHVVGYQVIMTGDTNFDTVTLGAGGQLIGSSYDMTAPVAVVHKWNKLQFDSGEIFLAEGRKAGTVTYNIGSLSGTGDARFLCAYFAASVASDQTTPIVNFEGDVSWNTTQSFPVFPLLFNGVYYDITQFTFSGDNAVVSMPTNTNVDCNKVTVAAGKTVTFRSGKFNLSKNQLDATGDFEIYGTAKFETPVFVWSYTGGGTIAVKNGGVLGTNYSGGLASTGLGGGSMAGTSVSFEPNAGVMYFGGETQVTGTLLPATVGKLVLDKSAGVLTLSGNLKVDAIDLLNGTLDTDGSYTLTGPLSGKLKKVNGNITGANWVPLPVSLSVFDLQ